MKEGWKFQKISDVCDVVNGGTPKTGVDEYWNGHHLWITPAEMGKLASPYVSATKRMLSDAGLANSSARLMPPNSIILSSRAPIGHLVINTKPMATNQGCKGLVPNKNLDYKYLYYFLSGNVDLLNSLGTGATFKELSATSLKDVRIPVPPIEEQRRIVAILDEAFACIDKAKANTEKNIQNARALFESHLNAVFTQRGDGWTSATVGELVEQQLLAKPLDGNHGEIHPKKSDFVSSGVPFIMAAHLSNGSVDQENCYFITKKQAGSLRKGFAKNGDVLLSHKGTIGRVAILETSHDFVVLTPQVTFYRILDDTVLHTRYLYFFFQSPKFQDEMNGIAGGGSTRAYIGITKQQELRIDYPRLENQKRIASTLEQLACETQRLESIYQRKLAALDELKQSLLHQAFSGNI